ncbi:MAG: trypsin-like peptidase domain-containing protein [Pyrinomonadaceae bacterium]|nr:trypsin-like peptidase domain-containing protein [Pyrinomonadaceae bacterium]MCX7640871.1 trypsin-like peptidase domain-containing protein [Pyrinomonadaceae bacterium]MDW8304285.1 trypsin-like peptidase domain-containing protein [Acidobacteriota bacterium]
MKKYNLSARQLLLIVLSSAFISVVITACLGDLTRENAQDVSKDKVLAETNTETPIAGVSDPSKVSDEQNNIEVYRAVAPGVVSIKTSARFETFFGEEFEQESGSGSGSVIDKEGHILTNYHVIEGASKLTVSFGGDKVYPAKVVGGDPDTDLAVIKIDAPRSELTVVEFGDSDKLVVGQKVLAIGNPFGLDRTLTTGVISALQRPIRARNGRPIDAAIQTDASINPGNSGGPLLDKYGRMIGINSQILTPAGGSVGVGFAIPVNIAKRVVPQLIQFGEVRRPKLGAAVRSVEELVARGYRLPVENGLVILQVLPGGSADMAGLRGVTADGYLGDIILSIDGQAMNNLDDLYRFLDKKQIGDTVQVEIYRNGRKISIPMKLTTIPIRQNRRF